MWVVLFAHQLGHTVGTVSTATVPDGVDYRATDGRPHYTATDGRPHYRAEDGRPHYRVED